MTALIHLVPHGGPSWTTACGKKVDPGTDQRGDTPEDAIPADQWIGPFGRHLVTCPECLSPDTPPDA